MEGLVANLDQQTEGVKADIGTMRASVQHVYGEPTEVFSVEDTPVPSIDEDEVLVKVHAAGVNWADWSMTRGMPYVMRLGYGLSSPRQGIRGTDVAGSVVDVGAAVTEFHVGDAVFGWCTGAFAEYTAVSADHLIAKPAGLSFEAAAGLPMAGCVALQAVRDVAGIEPGDRVLVVGASGGIGSLAVQIAKAYGADVTGVSSTTNLEFVTSLGADRAIDYTKQDFTLGDARYDMILDIADTHSLGDRRRILTEHGTLIPNSGHGGLWLGSLPRILGAWAMSPFVSQHLRPFLSMAKQGDLEELTALIDAGELVPMVGSTHPLSAVGAAIAEAGSGHARGKVIVSVNGDQS
jgi:NADPH:quinone reductase-like Zn-dependent oxidoreductase